MVKLFFLISLTEKNLIFEMLNMNIKIKIISFFIAVLFITGFALAKDGSPQPYTVKLATLAPEGSTWMNVMRELDKEIREKSNNRMKLKIYAGGVSGDEKDVIRKIRIGQLHAGGFSGVGMGQILPEVRVLDLPFLFNNRKEIDHIYNTYFEYFSNLFHQKGYTLLGWVEVGPVHIFSNKPITTIKDMAGIKMWMWEGDLLANEMIKALGLSPYPLSVTDVLISLQTGLIDTVYGSPLAAISLQWFTKIKYISMYPLGNASGAVLLSNKFFNKLPADFKSLLMNLSKKHFSRLIALTRKDNDKSIKVMEEAGITLVKEPEGIDLKAFSKAGKIVRENLVEKLYSRDLLEKIISSLNSFRIKK